MEAVQVREKVLNIIADISMEDDLGHLKDDVALKDGLSL